MEKDNKQYLKLQTVFNQTLIGMKHSIRHEQQGVLQIIRQYFTFLGITELYPCGNKVAG